MKSLEQKMYKKASLQARKDTDIQNTHNTKQQKRMQLRSYNTKRLRNTMEEVEWIFKTPDVLLLAETWIREQNVDL